MPRYIRRLRYLGVSSSGDLQRLDISGDPITKDGAAEFPITMKPVLALIAAYELKRRDKILKHTRNKSLA